MALNDGKPQQHYFGNIDQLADQQIQACLAFFKSQSLTFYTMEESVVKDERLGKQRYVTISVSIKLS